jgi:hypothetical protein
MFIRKFYSHTFQLLQEKDWDMEFAQKLMNVLKEGVLLPNAMTVPSGLSYHTVEVFLEELLNIEPQNVG